MKYKIEYLNDAGVGVAFHLDKKIFIPYTIDGEEVIADIIFEKNRYSTAKLKEITIPSISRATPPCPYYHQCGGCNLQHLNEDKYYNYKQQLLQNAIRRADFQATDPMIYIIGKGTRRRTNFKIEGTKIGYYKAGSHEIVETTHCLVLDNILNNAILTLKKLLQLISNQNIYEISLTNCNNGIDCLLTIKHPFSLTEKNLLADFITKTDFIRISYKYDDFVENIITKHIPIIKFGKNEVELPINSFLQVSKESVNIITSLILKHSKGYRNIADLFAGIGTYSFILAEHANISSYEGNENMVNAIKTISLRNDLTIKPYIRDLYQNPLTIKELVQHDLIVINPPRNGAEPQIANIKSADVIMVSCNPSSFSRDARLLKKNGYELQNIYGVDQFYWTNHLEIVAYFKAAR